VCAGAVLTFLRARVIICQILITTTPNSIYKQNQFSASTRALAGVGIELILVLTYVNAVSVLSIPLAFQRARTSKLLLLPLCVANPINVPSSLSLASNRSMQQQWQAMASSNRSSSENIDDHLSYLDPSKTNPIPNSALKALQKNAIKSYFERQQQSMRESKSSNSENNENCPAEAKTSQNQTQPNNSDVIRSADVSLQQQQQQHRISSSDNQLNDIKNNLNRSISRNTFTSFCEIKTENNYKFIHKGRGEYVKSASMVEEMVVDGSNSSCTNDSMPPPPLPRKSNILRR
jgi:flagellar biosynthesis GTPase FlhF